MNVEVIISLFFLFVCIVVYPHAIIVCLHEQKIQVMFLSCKIA